MKRTDPLPIRARRPFWIAGSPRKAEVQSDIRREVLRCAFLRRCPKTRVSVGANALASNRVRRHGYPPAQLPEVPPAPEGAGLAPDGVHRFPPLSEDAGFRRCGCPKLLRHPKALVLLRTGRTAFRSGPRTGVSFRTGISPRPWPKPRQHGPSDRGQKVRRVRWPQEGDRSRLPRPLSIPPAEAGEADSGRKEPDPGISPSRGRRLPVTTRPKPCCLERSPESLRSVSWRRYYRKGHPRASFATIPSIPPKGRAFA
jgi:hypothetical protein